MLVAEDRVVGLDLGAGHARALQAADPVADRLAGSYLLHCLNELGAVGVAGGSSNETRVVLPVRPAHDFAEPVPVGLRGRADGEVAVRGTNRLVGRGALVRRAEGMR